jgi:hypothetical protein
MRPRKAFIGLALTTGALSGCTAEVIGSSSEETSVTFDTTELGSISVESTLPSTESTIPSLPASTLPRVEFSIEDEMKILNDLRHQNNINTRSTPVEKTIAEILPEQENEEFIFPKEMLIDGNKIADIRLTNPDGDVLVDMPLFVVTDLFNNELVDEQLKRGAMLLVAHPEVNPGKFGDELGVPQMGLPGESQGVVNNFGHNISYVNPDFDGDIANGNEGELQQVFYRLDEVVPGAELIYDFIDSSGLDDVTYVLSDTKVVRDVQPGGEGTGMGFDKAFELYGRSTESSKNGVQLIKCTPDGSVKDRFVAFFELAE